METKLLPICNKNKPNTSADLKGRTENSYKKKKKAQVSVLQNSPHTHVHNEQSQFNCSLIDPSLPMLFTAFKMLGWGIDDIVDIRPFR